MKTTRGTISAVLCAIASAFAVSPANGALIVLPEVNAGTLAASLISGSGFQVSNATLIGATAAGQEQQGTFSGGTSDGGGKPIGIAGGVILSTGRAENAEGPNNAPGATSQLGTGGDADLSNLLGGTATRDANVLTLTFRPDAAGTLVFRYVFASEEYNDVGATAPTPFDDVFGLFYRVDGGVYGNLAKGPGYDRVSVNAINCGPALRNDSPPGTGPNCSLFINNDSDAAPFFIQYDGFTQVLTAEINVEAGRSYGLKLAIADAPDDTDLDSAVFIAGEFRAGGNGNGNGNGAPEPASMALTGIALLALGVARRRKRSAAMSRPFNSR